MKNTKHCSLCKNDLPLTEFNIKNKKTGQLQYICKSCNKEDKKRRYIKNKSLHIEKISQRKKEIVVWFKDLKSTLECVKCGENHPATLDFHHKNSKDKKFLISKAVNEGYSIENLIKEINKCEILCANCHRKLHYEETNVILS